MLPGQFGQSIRTPTSTIDRPQNNSYVCLPVRPIRLPAKVTG